jgi:hypothetical protein
MRDSNPRPSVYKTTALPTELIRRRGRPLPTNDAKVSRLTTRLVRARSCACLLA